MENLLCHQIVLVTCLLIPPVGCIVFTRVGKFTASATIGDRIGLVAVALLILSVLSAALFMILNALCTLS